MNKRIFYYDFLRAMAIIGIVFCHVSVYFLSFELNTFDFTVAAFFDCFRDFSIPVFVMLSGILLIGREESFKLFFKKRLSRLLIPFLFWVLVYILYSNNYTIANMSNILFGVSGSLGVTFWFVWMIILMYIGIYIINRIIQFKSKSDDDFTNRFMIALAIASLIYIMIIHFGLFNPYPSRLTYFASFITYIIFGYVIANNDLVGGYVGSEKLVLITSAASIILYAYYILSFVVPRSLNAHTFVVSGYFSLLLLLLSVNVFAVFKYLSKTGVMDRIEKNRAGEIIMLISKYSFGIYLVHYLIINMLKFNVFKYISLPTPLISIPFVAIVTLALSIALLWVLNRIPVLRNFTGFN